MMNFFLLLLKKSDEKYHKWKYRKISVRNSAFSHSLNFYRFAFIQNELLRLQRQLEISDTASDLDALHSSTSSFF